MESLSDLFGPSFTLLGTSVITNYKPHTWSEKCPTRNRSYHVMMDWDSSCDCNGSVTHIDTIIGVWLDGRPVTAKPSDATFNIYIWNFPFPYTVDMWQQLGEYSMLWDRPYDTAIAIAATVDPSDQEFKYREIIKPYMKGSVLKDKLELSKATFRAQTSSEKYLSMFEQRLANLMTGVERPFPSQF